MTQTLNFFHSFTFFIVTCCCGRLTTTSPTAYINKTDEIHVDKVEVIFNNTTVFARENAELVCQVTPKNAALATVWIKENEVILENQRIMRRQHKLRIDRVMESDAGYYTCSVKTPFGIQNKTAFLTVIQPDEDDDESGEQDEGGDYSGEVEECGRPKKKLISTCERSFGFTNCKSFAPAVNFDDIEIIQTLVDIKKNLPLRVKVQWQVPKAGNSDIWGWQIVVADVGPLPGFHKCIQLNRKFIWESDNRNFYVNYTFEDIHLGAKLKIQIQSLPAVDKNKGVEKEILTKGYCDVLPESICCYQPKNVVMEQMDTTSAMITWPDLTSSNVNLTMLSGFAVKYSSANQKDACHEKSFKTSAKDAINQSRIMVSELRPHCQNYTFQVIPIFSTYGCSKCDQTCHHSSMTGRRSKLYFFQMTNVQTSEVQLKYKQPVNLLKVIVVVVVVLAITIFSALSIIIWKKRHTVEKSKEPDTISKERAVTEVFIAHGSHCKDCEDAVLSVATYLNMTGHCKCFLDLCSLPKEWSPGKTQYYENKIAKCQKVIVFFTINEIYELEENVKVRNFKYQKNLIRSELFANCPSTKFIPVYLDFLSDLDIPSFLRNKKSFSLPSQLTELILYIIEEPVCKPVPVCPMLSIEEDSSLIKQKKILESKIKDLDVKHKKKLKIKNNNMLAKIV